MKRVIFAVFLVSCGGGAEFVGDSTSAAGSAASSAGAGSSSGAAGRAGAGAGGSSSGAAGSSSGAAGSGSSSGAAGSAGVSGSSSGAAGSAGVSGSSSGAGGVSACLAGWRATTCGAQCSSGDACADILDCYETFSCKPSVCSSSPDAACGANKIGKGMDGYPVAAGVYSCLQCPQ